MIDVIFTRFGIPRWGAIAMLCVLTALGALAYRASLIRHGVAIESGRRDAVDAENARQAKAALATLNTQVKAAQGKLTAAIADLAQLKTELDNEKTASAVLQSDLAAGRRRLSVLTRPRKADPAGHDQAAGTAAMDPRGDVTADLSPRVASDLEWLRQTRNDAIGGLHACITAYDAVKTASDVQ
jgi:hypothetical protein